MQQSAFETYSVRLPGGRVVTRALPIGAADSQVRSAFADVYRQAGYEPARAAVVRPPAEVPQSDGSELRAYEPTWSEWIGDRAYSLGTAMGLTSTADRMRREVGQLPVVGDLLTFLSGTEAVGRGDYLAGAGDIGLAGIGLLPGFGDAAATGMRQGIRRLYHGGTPGIAGEFEPSFAGRASGTAREQATWFTPDPDEALRFANEANAPNPWATPNARAGATVYPVDADTSGFLRVRVSDSPHAARDGSGQLYDADFFGNTIEQARSQGYRGVVFEGVIEAGNRPRDQYAIFDD